MRLINAAILVVFAVVSSPPFATADPPDLSEFPAEIKPDGQYAKYIPKVDAKSIIYVGLDGIEPFPPEFLPKKTEFILDVYGKPAKVYRFSAIASSGSGEQARKDFTVTIGIPPLPPTPPEPIPPQPPPGPVPPEPKPDPAPIPGPGFRVLMVYDNEHEKIIGPGQRLAIYGGTVREYLIDKTTSNGESPGYRIYGDELDVSGEEQWIRDAYKRAYDKSGGVPANPTNHPNFVGRPWIIISNGVSGFEGPIPDSGTLELLKKYGGP